MLSWCEWDTGSSCNWRKKLKNRYLVFLVSIMYVFWNASFYVASILSETQLTVFNMKGCMEKMPKWILILFSPFTCYTTKHNWICASVSHKLLCSFFRSTIQKKICCGVVKIYPCECPRMLPDSVFWTTCHYFYI